MNKTKSAIVSGTFYPDDKNALTEVIKNKTTRIITNFEEMFEVISKQKRPKKTEKGLFIPKEFHVLI